MPFLSRPVLFPVTSGLLSPIHPSACFRIIGFCSLPGLTLGKSLDFLQPQLSDLSGVTVPLPPGGGRGMDVWRRGPATPPAASAGALRLRGPCAPRVGCGLSFSAECIGISPNTLHRRSRAGVRHVDASRGSTRPSESVRRTLPGDAEFVSQSPGAREVWGQPGEPRPQTWAGVSLCLVAWGAGGPSLGALFAGGPTGPDSLGAAEGVRSTLHSIQALPRSRKCLGTSFLGLFFSLNLV